MNIEVYPSDYEEDNAITQGEDVTFNLYIAI
jgi:hypothetical protein